MKKGLDIDPATGLPREKVQTDRANQDARKEELTLKEKASLVGIVESPEGRKIITLIEEALMHRIDQFIKQDPAAQELSKLLSTLGVKDNQARAAVDQLHQRYLTLNT